MFLNFKIFPDVELMNLKEFSCGFISILQINKKCFCFNCYLLHRLSCSVIMGNPHYLRANYNFGILKWY